MEIEKEKPIDSENSNTLVDQVYYEENDEESPKAKRATPKKSIPKSRGAAANGLTEKHRSKNSRPETIGNMVSQILNSQAMQNTQNQDYVKKLAKATEKSRAYNKTRAKHSQKFLPSSSTLIDRRKVKHLNNGIQFEN